MFDLPWFLFAFSHERYHHSFHSQSCCHSTQYTHTTSTPIANSTSVLLVFFISFSLFTHTQREREIICCCWWWLVFLVLYFGCLFVVFSSENSFVSKRYSYHFLYSLPSPSVYLSPDSFSLAAFPNSDKKKTTYKTTTPLEKRFQRKRLQNSTANRSNTQ